MAGTNAQRRSNSGYYYWPPNDPKAESFVSVTTILGALAKPALVGWAAREVAEYAVKNWDGAVAGLINTGQHTAAIDLLKGAPWRNRDKAADFGSGVHKLVEAVVDDRPVAVTDEERPFLMAFSAWVVEFSPVFEYSEVTVFNRKCGYAGTLDLIVTLGHPDDGERWLVDVKTGKGIYPEHALQLAAYMNGEFIGLGDYEEPMPAISRAAILHLRPEGYSFVPVRTDPDMFIAFRHIIESYRFLNVTCETALGVPLTPPSTQKEALF